MTAAARNPTAPKKRKIDDRPSQPDEQHAKKKSPLFNQPQKFYAPTSISSMSREELSEWRKEQRRKRNRESAAASRNKTRARIDELEGEVTQWKGRYNEMEIKMRCMERHIQFLTKLDASSLDQDGQPRLADDGYRHQLPLPLLQLPMVVSHPNSPPRSPSPSASPPSNKSVVVVPNAVTSQLLPPPPAYSSNPSNHPSNHFATSHLFPSLLSEPQDCTLVETRTAVNVAAAIMLSDDDDDDDDESRSHLNSIPRQAVKITGATKIDSSSIVTEQVEQQQKQPTGLPACDSSEKNKEMMVEVGSIASSGTTTPDVTSVEVTPVTEVKEHDQTQVADGVLAQDNMPALDDSMNDADLLDLLVDTLDGEFDPNLLV
mmetsp:Transcript_31058/g.59002  ORF Transcript_31058/g.59002 Transcript_31058/m.59002 type:complete len:374 (-) Transcript_31058:377-1498(-)